MASRRASAALAVLLFLPACQPSTEPCAPNRTSCEGACVDTQVDLANCGACGQACPTPPHGTAACAGGTCRLGACAAGWGSCDGDDANGCETQLSTTVASCGACGAACPALAHATAVCLGGVCGLGSCTVGWADCDGLEATGCETSLDGHSDCGACGHACAPGDTCVDSTCLAPVGRWAVTGSTATLSAGGECRPELTTLLDGRVLLTGHCNPSDVTQLYDPATGTWSFTGSTQDPRSNSAMATALPDGRVLLSGGSLVTPGVCELYDPATETWSLTGALGAAWCSGGAGFAPTGYATRLLDGRVLLAGGGGAQLYDPDTGTWSVTGSTALSDEYGTATLLRSGKVLLAGGWCWGTADLYDPATDRWAPAAPLTVPQMFQAAALLEPSGEVLVVEGDRCQDTGLGASAELFTE